MVGAAGMVVGVAGVLGVKSGGSHVDGAISARRRNDFMARASARESGMGW